MSTCPFTQQHPVFNLLILPGADHSASNLTVHLDDGFMCDAVTCVQEECGRLGTCITTAGAISPPPEPVLLMTIFPTASCCHASFLSFAKSFKYCSTLLASTNCNCTALNPQKQVLLHRTMQCLEVYPYFSSCLEGRGILVSCSKNFHIFAGSRPDTGLVTVMLLGASNAADVTVVLFWNAVCSPQRARNAWPLRKMFCANGLCDEEIDLERQIIRRLPAPLKQRLVHVAENVKKSRSNSNLIICNIRRLSSRKTRL